MPSVMNLHVWFSPLPLVLSLCFTWLELDALFDNVVIITLLFIPLASFRQSLFQGTLLSFSGFTVIIILSSFSHVSPYLPHFNSTFIISYSYFCTNSSSAQTCPHLVSLICPVITMVVRILFLHFFHNFCKHRASPGSFPGQGAARKFSCKFKFQIFNINFYEPLYS